MAENKLSTVDQVHLQSIDFATQNLCKKLNALLLRPEAQLSEAPHWKTSGKPFSDQSIEWRFDLNEPISRRSTRSAIAVLIALIVTRWLNLPHGDWVPVSALIVSRDSVGNTFWKAQGRLLGTAFGVAAAVIFYALIFRHHTLMFVAAFITIFPYLYLRPSLSNYGYAKFFQQFAYICFLGSLRQGASVALMEWRAIDIAIGCSIGLAVTLLVLPNWSSSNWKQGLIKTWTDFQHFFQAIVTEYQSPELDPQAIQKLSQQTQKSVYKLDTHLEGRKHETLMRGDSLSQRLAVIQADRKIYEALLYLSYLAAESKQPQQPEILPPDAQTVIEQITAAFIEMQQFIGTRFSPQLPLVANRCRLPISGENGGVSVNRPQFNFLLALNQLCEEIEQFGETRCTYTHQQNHVTSATSGNRKP
ncbi:FUSC family protein [Neosynechococcus sphagnicola]|nr:FUSC family protein [Neosynechococcus sphagnicola]